jgi:hypothetical protein
LVPNLQESDLVQLCTVNASGEYAHLHVCLSQCTEAAWQVSDAISAHYFNHTDDADSVGA